MPTTDRIRTNRSRNRRGTYMKGRPNRNDFFGGLKNDNKNGNKVTRSHRKHGGRRHSRRRRYAR